MSSNLNSNSPSPQQRMATLRTVCMALVASVLIITVLPITGLLQPSPENREEFILPLAMSAILSIIASQIFRGLLFKPRRTSDKARDERDVWNKLLISTLVSFAILESAAILGMLLFIFTGNIAWPLSFGGVATLVMLGSWPKKETIDKALADL